MAPHLPLLKVANQLLDLPEPQNIGKTAFRYFSTFCSPASSFFLALFLLWFLLLLLLFSSLTLPTSAFVSVQIVGSWTSKLPSVSLLY